MTNKLGKTVSTVASDLFPAPTHMQELRVLLCSIKDDTAEYYRQVALAHIKLQGQNEKIDLELKLQAKVLRIQGWTIIALIINGFLLGFKALGL